MEKWTHVAQRRICPRIVAIPSSPNRSHHRALGVSRCSNQLTRIQANSRPTAKRVSSTARFTLGDGFGQAYAVKRREIVIRGIAANFTTVEGFLQPDTFLKGFRAVVVGFRRPFRFTT